MANVYVPIRVVSLQTASNPGNVYWKKVTFTNWEAQWPAMKANVESTIYGLVTLPRNLSVNNATKNIILGLTTTATSGTAKLQISALSVPWDSNAPEVLNGTFTAESEFDAALGMGWGGSDRPFISYGQALSLNIFADGTHPVVLAVKLFRNGDAAGDTMEADLELVDWYLEVEI